MIDLNTYKEDKVVVNLMLTNKCNFECAHCFYECSPKLQEGYMSADTLDKARVFIETLLNADIQVSVNFIGGEPTLNMKEFERCLNYMGGLQGDGCEFQMTTNGWWLKKEESTRRFFSIIAPYIDTESPEYGMTIRISQDRFHDEFRPNWLHGAKLQNRLNSVWEMDDPYFSIFTKEKWMCNECGEEGTGCEYECPECESEDIYIDEEILLPLIESPQDCFPWIYVERLSDNNTDESYVIPQGRGSNVGYNDAGGGKGHCTKGVITFRSTGVLSDICCRGSNCPMGTVDDDPFVLLEMARRFGEEAKPNCFECRNQWKNWMTENPDLKEKLQKEMKEVCELV